MTAVSSSANESVPTHAAKAYGRYSRSGDSAPTKDGDAVEISEEAKRLAKEADERPNLMEPAKTMRVGSEEYDAFRSLVDKVKTRKSDITSLIEAAIKESGVNLAGLGKPKIEVDASGKILVGGISDKRAARAIEQALNRDGSLGGKIREYQQNERELSKSVKDYTGCTLYELTMTSRGDINERIRKQVEGDGAYSLDPDFYMRLGFLGASGDLIGMDDIAELSFNGAIDFSGELNLIADPEGNVKKTLDELHASIQSAFDTYNAEIAETFKARGMQVDESHLLNAGNAVVRIDSNGGIEIEGMLSEDPETLRKGKKIIGKLVADMLSETENNSYHVNIFLAASHNFLSREGEAPAYAKAVAELANGKAGGIWIETPDASSGSLVDAKNAILKATRAVLR